MTKTKIIVALSGGVDSAMAAILLKKNGFYVEGIFMKNWTVKTDTECNYMLDLKYVKYICKNLKIKLHVIDLSIEYWNLIFLKFLKELKSGMTPNPDVLCNKKIKFYFLLKYILNFLNFNFLATGHYAKIDYIDKNVVLKNCFDLEKDQTYFLHKINSAFMKYIIFPLANYSKKEIRALIKYYNFLNYNKKDSMGLCFISNDNFYNFIKKYLTFKKGKILTKEKKNVGFHEGLFFYTIGQKKNINFKNKQIENNAIWYVYKKCVRENKLYIDQNYSSLLSSKIKLYKNVLNTKIFFPLICNVKIRHQRYSTICLIKKHNKNYIIIFKFKQRALTPGQFVVFYKKNLCIGGGIIKNILN